jgi:hypothetical protein
MTFNQNLIAKKAELISSLNSIQDLEILDTIINLISKNRIKNSELNLEKKSIEMGIKDANEGKINDHSKARAIYAKWL